MNIHEYLNQNVPIEDDYCFVIMPFDEKLDAIYHHGIKPIVEELGYRCRRADQHFASSPIMFEIFDDIMRARFIIADLTDSNPNVFYELGIAHALKKCVVLLKRAGSYVPFDLSGIRHKEYQDSFKGISDLRSFIAAALAECEKPEDGAVLNKKTLEADLKKACLLWKSGGEIVITFESFLEITLGLDLMSPSDEELAFLSRAAAYFGKFMKRMAEAIKTNRVAIRALVSEAASGTTVRVPWRAAAMLEYLDKNLVDAEVRLYSGDVSNSAIFPESILKRCLKLRLSEVIDEETLEPGVRDKLSQALRDIRAEFRVENPT